MRVIIGIIFCGTLIGCNVLPERQPVDLYSLPAPSLDSAGEGSIFAEGLRLARPDTSDALGGNRILLSTDGIRFQAFPDARWTAQVPVLWRDRLLDALWQDGRFPHISLSSDSLQASHELGGLLRALHIENGPSGNTALVRFDAVVTDLDQRTIVASRRFEARQPARGTSAIEGVRALGSAADRVTADLIDWLASLQ